MLKRKRENEELWVPMERGRGKKTQQAVSTMPKNGYYYLMIISILTHSVLLPSIQQKIKLNSKSKRSKLRISGEGNHELFL